MSILEYLLGSNKKEPEVSYTYEQIPLDYFPKEVQEMYAPNNIVTQLPDAVKIIGDKKNIKVKEGDILGSNPQNDIFLSNEQLVKDEGEIPYIYLDTLGNPTFGIGSLLSSHMDSLLNAGFTKEQIDSHVATLIEAKKRGELPKLAQNYPEKFQLKIPKDVYAKSFQEGLNDANIVYDKYTKGLDLPPEAVPVIKNLAYQLGPKLYKFTKLYDALKNKDYNRAADEILLNTATKEKSKLYKQAPNRTQRRADEIRKLAK